MVAIVILIVSCEDGHQKTGKSSKKTFYCAHIVPTNCKKKLLIGISMRIEEGYV